MSYSETDYYYDGTLCTIVCPGCIDEYKTDNKDFTEIDAIDGIKYWEGAHIVCDICGSIIESEYGNSEEAA